MLPSIVIYSILLVFTFCQFIKSAGEDDKTFDWLKDDDHIISNQDLHFLQEHHSHQSSGQHSSSHASPTSAGESLNQQQLSETRGTKRRRGGSEEQTGVKQSSKKPAKPLTEQQKRRKNELERQRQKRRKENDPIGYKAFREKRNEEERVRNQKMSLEQKKFLWDKQYKSRNKNKPPRPLTLEDHNKKVEVSRERRMRYESNLSMKILNNQATDEQIETYKKEFGKARYKNLMKKKN